MWNFNWNELFNWRKISSIGLSYLCKKGVKMDNRRGINQIPVNLYANRAPLPSDDVLLRRGGMASSLLAFPRARTIFANYLCPFRDGGVGLLVIYVRQLLPIAGWPVKWRTGLNNSLVILPSPLYFSLKAGNRCEKSCTDVRGLSVFVGKRDRKWSGANGTSRNIGIFKSSQRYVEIWNSLQSLSQD